MGDFFCGRHKLGEREVWREDWREGHGAGTEPGSVKAFQPIPGAGSPLGLWTQQRLSGSLGLGLIFLWGWAHHPAPTQPRTHMHASPTQATSRPPELNSAVPREHPLRLSRRWSAWKSRVESKRVDGSAPEVSQAVQAATAEDQSPGGSTNKPLFLTVLEARV